MNRKLWIQFWIYFVLVIVFSGLGIFTISESVDRIRTSQESFEALSEDDVSTAPVVDGENEEYVGDIGGEVEQNDASEMEIDEQSGNIANSDERTQDQGDDKTDANQPDSVKNIVPVTVRQNEKALIIGMADEAFDLEIAFDYTGPNRLFGFTSFRYDFPNVLDPFFIEVSSDFIGPYIVENLEGDADREAEFTGGWHVIDGFTTGRTTDIKWQFVVDGKTISMEDNQLSREEQKVDGVELTVTNIIDGYNDLEPALEETIIYHIKNGRIDVEVLTRALQEIRITSYYGLQSQNRPWWGTITYESDKGRVMEKISDESSFGFYKSYDVTRKITHTSTAHGVVLEMGLEEVGLGDYSYLAEDTTSAFTINYGKSYFNMVAGIPLEMIENDVFFWEGYYHFTFEDRW